MNRIQIFKAWADGVRAELRVCADDLAKGRVRESNKDGFNTAMNILASAYGYCLTGAKLAEHPMLGINSPNRQVMAGIVRGLQHVKERRPHSAASFMALQVDPTADFTDGTDYWAMLQNKKEPCSIEDVLKRMEKAVEEAVVERSCEVAAETLKDLLKALGED